MIKQIKEITEDVAVNTFTILKDKMEVCHPEFVIDFVLGLDVYQKRLASLNL